MTSARALVCLSLSLAACSSPRVRGAPHGDGSSDTFTDGATGPSGAGTACTGDLRGIVDSSGTVVATCPDDEGCAGAQCVAACDAAAASQGSIGCDYVVSTPSFYVGEQPPCFAVFVANSWPEPAQVVVERDGTSYDATTFGRIATTGQPVTSWAAIPSTGIPPGDVGVLFMSHDPMSTHACPVTPAVSQSHGTAVANDTSALTGRGQAFHITTSVPATLYDILPFGGARSFLPSASLLFPTTAWGTNYLGIVAKRSNSGDPQFAQIVASQDDTEVTVQPNVNLPSGQNVAAAPQGASTKYTLAAGEFLQWEDSHEMSGSIVQANKAIGFVGGTTYDCYTSTTNSQGGCDSNHQQIPPIRAYGSSYAVAPYATRLASLAPESIIYRVVGSVDGTVLTYDPPTTGAPTTLARAQVVDFQSTTGFVVSAQDDAHPFYVAQIMAGCNSDGTGRNGCTGFGTMSCCLGDEDTVNVLAPAQYLSSYIFFTDPTYATTNLVFTRAKTNGAFADVSLDCLGTVSGWKPLDAAGNYEFAQIDLIRGNEKVGSCDNGAHSASSTAGFGLTVWGLDSAASYGFPAGGNIGAINNVVVDPIQ